jgi:hypothetical protein
LDENKNKCIGCPDINCEKCKAEDTQQCLKCLPKYDVDDGKCILCDVDCLDCKGSANNCIKCQDKKYIDDLGVLGVCKDCLTNCKTCSDASKCTTCLDG